MYIGLHNHSDHSNTRGFLDSTNKVKALIEYAKECGHNGIAFTEHDTISSHMEVENIITALRKEDPEKWNDFKIILGNEIYLCDREQIEERKEYIFPHFILLAKDEIGHKQIRELSTRAWIENSFTYVNIRTPTYYEDLEEIVEESPGHLVASTGCLGGWLPRLILKANEFNPLAPDYEPAKRWVKKMVKIFGEGNFFLEMQPSNQEDQLIVNRALVELSDELGIDYVITTDAHYLKREDRKIHEAFLNSNEDSGRQRETGEFYATTYVMTEKEIHGYMDESLGYEAVQKGIDNTQNVRNIVKEYSLKHPLRIPYEPDDLTEPDPKLVKKYEKNIPLLRYFADSNYPSDRHMVRQLVNRFEKDKDEFCNQPMYEAIEICLDSIKKSDEAQGVHWSAYMLMVKDLIDACWAVGSLVGPLRGSAGGFVLLYALDVIQINALREQTRLFPWRFLNPERVSPLDIDCDFQNSYRPKVLEYLQHKYCGDDVHSGVRKVMKVQTLGTVKSKSALITAARGMGYSSEEGQFLASFIQAERGILYTLSQTYYGDPDNNILPNTEFVNVIDSQYKDVFEVALGIEGLIKGVGSHAGGVVVCSTIITDTCALMKTASGDIITQWDLHVLEQAGEIKYDLLGVDCLEKMHETLDLLLEDGYIEWQGTLRDTYEKYLGVYKINREDPEIWRMINQHEIVSLFQMEKQSGHQAISIGKPKSLNDLSALNSVMRLMAPYPGAESPLERYGRFRDDITLWYKEMREYGLTEDEIKVLRKHGDLNYSLLPNQELFMMAVQDPDLGGFGLLWADRLRKSIAKKNPKEFAQLQDEYYAAVKEKGLSFKMCDYFWKNMVSSNRGYGFNSSHTLGYSVCALQEANLARYYPIEYWNTANLISDSGGEDSTVRYGKIARAIGNFQKEGITVSLPNINDVRFDFRPKPDTHEIIYGLKPIQGVGAQVAKAIVAHQPYISVDDFYTKMTAWKEEDKENKFGDTTMISLIKAGCFDTLENKPREQIMKEFVTKLSSPLISLKMANIEDMNNAGLLTDAQKKYELRLFRFRKYLYQEKFLVEKAGKSPSTFFYKLDQKFAEPFFYEHFESLMNEGKDYRYTDDGFIAVKRGAIDKVFDKLTEDFRTKVLTNTEILDKINQLRFEEEWKTRADGTISQWEMQSMCMYYHEHELANVNRKAYAVANFFELPEEPEISDYYFYRNQQKPRFKLSRIVGTVIDKNSVKSTVTLLTPDGVVDVRFYKGQYIFYDRQISEVHEDGTKTVLEKSWFQRGNKLMITGFRRGEVFVPRQYKDSIYKHSAQKIMGIDEEGQLTLVSERVNLNEEG